MSPECSAHTALAVGRGRALSRCSTAAPTASACTMEVGGANIVQHRGGAGLPLGLGSAAGLLVSRSCRDTLQRQSVDSEAARWLVGSVTIRDTTSPSQLCDAHPGPRIVAHCAAACASSRARRGASGEGSMPNVDAGAKGRATNYPAPTEHLLGSASDIQGPAKPSAQDHARQLLEYLQGEPSLVGHLVPASELEWAYVLLCDMRKCQELPWQRVAAQLNRLTGGERSYRVDGRNVRAYYIPTPFA